MYDDNQIKDFYQNYRDSLDRQYQTGVANLDQQRRNDYASIMGAANKMGMLYSNFPQRDKIKYDQQNYQPNLIKLYQPYQTGLQKLRSNIINYQNQVKNIQEAINELNAS